MPFTRNLAKPGDDQTRRNCGYARWNRCRARRNDGHARRSRCHALSDARYARTNICYACMSTCDARTKACNARGNCWRARRNACPALQNSSQTRRQGGKGDKTALGGGLFPAGRLTSLKLVGGANVPASAHGLDAPAREDARPTGRILAWPASPKSDSCGEDEAHGHSGGRMLKLSTMVRGFWGVPSTRMTARTATSAVTW